MIEAQDDQIDNIGASVKVLKNLSTTIGVELEEQATYVLHSFSMYIISVIIGSCDTKYIIM